MTGEADWEIQDCNRKDRTGDVSESVEMLAEQKYSRLETECNENMSSLSRNEQSGPDALLRMSESDATHCFQRLISWKNGTQSMLLFGGRRPEGRRSDRKKFHPEAGKFDSKG